MQVKDAILSLRLDKQRMERKRIITRTFGQSFTFVLSFLYAANSLSFYWHLSFRCHEHTEFPATNSEEGNRFLFSLEDVSLFPSKRGILSYSDWLSSSTCDMSDSDGCLPVPVRGVMWLKTKKEMAGYKAYTAKQNDPQVMSCVPKNSQNRSILGFGKLFHGWERYFESRGKMEHAFWCYRKAEDNLSLCRWLCEQDPPTKVSLILVTTG